MLLILILAFIAIPILGLLAATYFLGRPENNGSFRLALKELFSTLAVGRSYLVINWLTNLVNLLVVFLLIWRLIMVAPFLFFWLKWTDQLEIYREH